MAADKVNTRQKMINMMYLVFIAMLALNISKEVLGTLGLLSSDMEKSTKELKTVIDGLYTNVETNSNNDYFEIPAEELPKIKELSDSYWSYIQRLKDSLISLDKNSYMTTVKYKDTETAEKLETTMVDYQIMDKSTYTDELFFDGDNNTSDGDKFESYFSSFVENVSSVLDSIRARDEKRINLRELDEPKYEFASSISNLNSRFNYSAEVLNTDGNFQPWLEYNYKGFPLIASLSKFTKIQSDIRSVEYDILNYVESIISAKAGGLNNYGTLLESTKSAYYTNTVVDAKIVAGRTDSGFKPDREDLKIDGVKLRKGIDYDVKDGGIVLNRSFSSAGEKKLSGTLYFLRDGELDSLSVSQKFFVIDKPNEAIVSPVNMQVFYIGLRNEIAVAFPGIADLTSIRVAGKNGTILRTGSRYFAAPNAGAESMDVVVSGKANDEVVTSLVNFRVEDAPPGRGSVYERVGGQDYNFINSDKISKESLLYGMIRGEKPPGFLYDYDIEVIRFQITIGGLTTKNCTGNSVQNCQEAVRDINVANVGSSVTVTVLEATKIDGDLRSPTDVEPFVLTIK